MFVLDLVQGYVAKRSDARQGCGMSDFLEFNASRMMPVPVAVVWQIASDPRRNAQWCNNVQKVIRASASLDIGEDFEERSVVLGPWTSITRWTLLTSDLHRERTFTGTGFPGVSEVRPFLRFSSMTDPSGIEHAYVTYGSSLRLSCPRLNRIAKPILRAMLTSEFATSLANLETLAGRQSSYDSDV